MLGMTQPQGFVDTGRALLRIAGAEAREWLQSLVTNDVRRLAPGRAVYAALLSAQGKYLFDFILVDAGDGTILLDVAAERAGALLPRLNLYRLRRQVSVASEPGLGVALLWDGEAPSGPLAVADPRSPALGWRLYAPDPAAALAAAGAAPAPAAAYAALRIAAAVPESGVELVPDDSYILEAGFERLNGVDFRKGCYVGQEVTARMHHKTELRKGLKRVAVEGEAPPPGTDILTPEGKVAGTLHSTAGGQGLAHLRFDRMEGPLAAGAARVTLLPD
jgi:folate-binding protein YgfZ